MVDEVTGLTMKVDTRQVKTAQGDLREFAKQADKTEKSVDGLENETGKLGKTSKVTGRSQQGLSSAVRTTGAAAAATARTVASMSAALVTVGGAAGAFAIKTAQANKEIDAIARSVGVGTTVLQQWGFAAKEVGFSTEKVGDIFKDTAEKIGDFVATGGGEAKDVFEQLNLQAKDLANLKPDQQLLKIAESLGQVQTQGEKIFLLESLANDASRLLPLLEDNAKGLKELTGLAVDFGVALSEQDNQTLLDLARATDLAAGAAQGLGNQISVSLAPTIIDLTDNFVEGVAVVSKYFDAIDRGIRLLRGEDTVLDRINLLVERRVELQKELSELQDDPGFFDRLYGDRTQAQIRALNTELELNSEQLESAKLLLKTQNEIKDEQIKKDKKVLAGIRGNTDGVTKLTKAQKDALALIKQIQTPQQKYNEAQKDYDRLLKAGLLTTEQYNRALGLAQAALWDYNAAQIAAAEEGGVLAEISETLAENAENEAQAIDSVTTALERQREQQAKTFQELGDFLSGAISGTTSLSSVFGQIGKAGLSGGIAGLAQAGSDASGADFLSGGLNAASSLLPSGAMIGLNNALGLGGLAEGLGTLAADFALSGFGTALGLSTAATVGSAATTGAALAANYGLTTGVAAGTTAAATGATATAAGGSLIGSAATLGPIALAAAAIPLLMGFFGGKPSDKTQSFGVDLALGQQFATESFTGDKFSQGSRDIADAAGQLSLAFAQALSIETGKTVNDQIAFIAGERDGLRVQVNGVITDVTNSASEFLQISQETVAESFGVTTDIYNELAQENEQLVNSFVRVEQQFDLLNEAADVMGLNFSAVGEDGKTAADILAEAAGGIATLSAEFDTYYNNFFSEEERATSVRNKARDAINEFNSTLGLSGKAAIDTREELRDYIEAQDLATEAGANAAASALDVVDSLLTMEQAAQQLSDEFQSTNQFLLENFFTQEQQRAGALNIAAEAIAEYNEALGLSEDAFIDSSDELRDYVNALDTSTDAGKQALIGIKDLAAAILDLESAASSASTNRQQVSTDFGDVSVDLIDVASLRTNLSDARTELAKLPDQIKSASKAATDWSILFNKFGDESAKTKAADAQQLYNDLIEDQDAYTTSISALVTAISTGEVKNQQAIAKATQAAKDQAAATNKAAAATVKLTDIGALNIRLLQAQGKESEALTMVFDREREATNDAGDAILDQIEAIQLQEIVNRKAAEAAEAAARISEEATDLNIRLLELTGNAEGALALTREKELAAIDESNIELQKAIYLEEDRLKAIEKANSAQQLLVNNADSAFGDLGRAISSEIDILRDQFELDSDAAKLRINSAQQSLAATKDLANSVGRTLNSLKFDSIELDRRNRTRAQSELRSILTSGILPDDFDKQLGVLAEPSADLFGSFVDYQRDFFKTANDISTLNELTGEQLTEDQRALATAESTLEALQAGFDAESNELTAILNNAQLQLDVLNGINGNIMNLGAAQAAFSAAATAAARSAGISSTGIQGSNTVAARAQQDLAASRRPKATSLTLPAFATGGDHTGGLRLVGEHGPEIEATGPSRIYSNSDTKSMLSGMSGGASDDVYNMLSFKLDKLLSFIERSYRLESKWDGDALNVRVVT